MSSAAPSSRALPAMRLRLEFFVAVLVAAGGMVLASGDDTDAVALIAIFSAVFGFLLVDWLRVFFLPPFGAYLGMAGAATYCVYNFLELHRAGQPQMASVALLLVLVQGVLMFQPKTRRILEQLAVFCLLELVVAAIFNDALNFGLLMIPITIVGAAVLSLLGLVSTMEDIPLSLDPATPKRSKTKWGRVVSWLAGHEQPKLNPRLIATVASPQSAVGVYLSARAWTRFAILTLSPAILLVGLAFFYTLPRKVDAARASGGSPMVGFDDEVRLEQLGQVMQNPKIALKIKLTDARTKASYRVHDGLYLRGNVLEKYELDTSRSKPVAKWIATNPASLSRHSKLPRKYFVRRPEEFTQFDDVQVKLTCESMSQPALFAIAPYHGLDTVQDIEHATDRWTLSRSYDQPPFPRTVYEFGTHAFHRGNQTRWISQAPDVERAMMAYAFDFRRFFGKKPDLSKLSYVRELTRVDRERLPTVVELANKLKASLPESNLSSAMIARTMEQFLRRDPQFKYTLKLDAKPVAGMDPIEQFLSVDRRGHCQYFATALALMLRSVDIPCRVVVGYRTQEYNEIGEYYIARQEHAHSWVEALIDRSELPPGLTIGGQRDAGRYWYRLDPTPEASEIDDGEKEGVDGLLRTANNLWEDLVVDMDAQRQPDQLTQASGLGAVQSSYQNGMNQLEQYMGQIRSGRLGGGSLSVRGGSLFGLGVLAVGIVFAALATMRWLIKRLRHPRRSRMDRSSELSSDIAGPHVEFYAQVLEQLQRVGIHRQRDETPTELCLRAQQSVALTKEHRQSGNKPSALQQLTLCFELVRYGNVDGVPTDQIKQWLAELDDCVDQTMRGESRSL